MWEKLKKQKTILFCLLAFAVGILLSYSLFNYQSSQERQVTNGMLKAALLQNASYSEMLQISDDTNKILTDCLNSKSCNTIQAASQVDALNARRDAAIQKEEQTMGQIKTMMP